MVEIADAIANSTLSKALASPQMQILWVKVSQAHLPVALNFEQGAASLGAGAGD
jgi:hypothetical protein